jgi:hypothetical protein
MSEVSISNGPYKWTDRIGDSRYKHAARSERLKYLIECIKDFVLRQVFEKIRCGYSGDLAPAFRQDLPVVALTHLMQALRVREGNLLWADIDTFGIVAVRKKLPDKLTLSASNVEYLAAGRRWQQRPDVATVNESSSGTVAPASMLGCVSLVESLAQWRFNCRRNHWQFKGTAPKQVRFPQSPFKHHAELHTEQRRSYACPRRGRRGRPAMDARTQRVYLTTLGNQGFR